MHQARIPAQSIVNISTDHLQVKRCCFLASPQWVRTRIKPEAGQVSFLADQGEVNMRQ